MSPSLVLVIILVILWFSNAVYKRWLHFRTFKVRGIPGPKPSFFIGNLRTLRSRKHPFVLDVFSKWEKEYGDIYGYFIGVQPCLVIRNLRVVKDVLVRESYDHFSARLTPVVQMKPLMSTLVGTRGQKWKELRNVLSRAFSARRMRQMTELMNVSISTTQQILKEKNGEELDILCLFQGLACEVISVCALAMETRAQRDSHDPFLVSIKEFLGHAVTPALLPAICFTWLSKTFQFAIDKFAISARMTRLVCENVERVMVARREQQKRQVESGESVVDSVDSAKSVKYPDILQSLMDAEESGASITDEEIVANSWIFLLGGFETTSAALTFITYLLAKNHQVQQLLFDELSSAFREDEIPPYELVNNLTYLNQVICEALRLYPPVVTFVIRETDEEIRVGDFVVPKGMRIQVPVWQIHHDPKLWGPDPYSFDPTRFSSEARESHDSMAWIPFGAGPRSCIGMRFALLQIKLTIARLVRSFRIVATEKTTEDLKLTVPTVTIVPTSPLILKFQHRSHLDDNQNNIDL